MLNRYQKDYPHEYSIRYGSNIMMSVNELNIYSHYIDKCYKSYIELLIHKFINENLIQKSYCLSAWNQFHKERIIYLIDESCSIQKKRNELKLISMYVLQNYLNNDILYLILNK